MVSGVGGSAGVPGPFGDGGQTGHVPAEGEGQGPTPRGPDERLPARRSSAGAAPKAIPAGTGERAEFRQSPPVKVADERIPEGYINALEAKISVNFSRPYPAEHLSATYISLRNSPEGFSFDAPVIARYNPFGLRLPYRLEGEARLYDHTRIDGNSPYGRDPGKLPPRDAISTYLDLVKQYNLAYITVLRAVNGSDQALEMLKTLFGEEKIFEVARTKMNFLAKNHSNRKTLDAMIGHLCFDVLRSKDLEIPTAARIRALELVRDHFDINGVATHLTSGGESLGFRIEDNEKVYDLIPPRFATKPEESGGTPHNALFWENEKVKQIFREKPNSNGRGTVLDIDRGVAELLSRYPGETVQVLLGVMRTDNWKANGAVACHALIGLTTLDGFQKERVFGDRASYRHGEAPDAGFQTRIGWTTGAVEGIGDYLDEEELGQLSPRELIQRMRQMAYRMEDLEARVVELEAEKAAPFATLENDPRGYFRALGLHPDTPEDVLDELVKRNYRVFARKHHPDAGGDEELFKLIELANSVLSDPKRREQYRQSGR